MNKGDEHGSKQKGLVLQRGPHGATPLLTSAVGTESLRYDHLTVRRGIEGFGRCLFRGGDDDCDKKHCCEDHFHFSLRNLSPSGKLNKFGSGFVTVLEIPMSEPSHSPMTIGLAASNATRSLPNYHRAGP